jgi:hypothetical protein
LAFTSTVIFALHSLQIGPTGWARKAAPFKNNIIFDTLFVAGFHVGLLFIIIIYRFFINLVLWNGYSGPIFEQRLKEMNKNNRGWLIKFLNWLQKGAAKSAPAAGNCPT